MHILKMGFGQDFGLNAGVRCAFCDISDQNIRVSPLLPSFSSARGILETQWCRCRQHQPAFHDDLSDARFQATGLILRFISSSDGDTEAK